MSPTYWTASLITSHARGYGWEIRPTKSGDKPWTLHRGNVTIEVMERPDGGLAWVSWTHVFEDGCDKVVHDQRTRNKRTTVLGWLRGEIPPVLPAWRAKAIRAEMADLNAVDLAKLNQ